MRNVILLGATGSIGMQTLDLIREFNHNYKLTAFSFYSNMDKAIKIIDEFNPLSVCCGTIEQVNTLKIKYPHIDFYYGNDGLIKLVSLDGEVVNAIVGSTGVIPTYHALLNHKDVYLANKESLIMAGSIIMKLAKELNLHIIPIDSEHSAIYQILNDNNKLDINRLLVTASGGSFRNKTRDELINVTVEDALNHPNWSMGKKITIDSATMMNKGFELIEAHYLFDVDIDYVIPVLHYESIVHSMVEFNDGSIMAQMGSADMHLPIKYALEGPSHSLSNSITKLDITKGLNLSFKPMDYNRYPLVKVAIDALKKGSLYPAIMCSANDIAVEAFINKKISFLDIEKIIINALNNKKYTSYCKNDFTIDDVLKVSELVKNDLKNMIYGGCN